MSNETKRKKELPLIEDSSDLDISLVPSYSEVWASFVRPFTYIFFSILVGIVFVPLFAFIFSNPSPQFMDWLKTVLSFVSALGGIIVGYWFGRKD
jgi:hypothetical protein